MAVASPVFSDPGAVLATFLHTFGAIGYMGGIAFYVGWARSVQRGHDNPGVLATGASLTYISILANLLGGFVRTYQPGHPGVYEFGTNTWVTVMVVKHVALFAGMGAAVYLFELHAPRLRRATRDDVALPSGRARGARAMLSTVVASILVAAVLGGVSTVLDLGTGPDGPGAGIALPQQPKPVTLNHNGSVTANLPESGSFDVPQATSRIDAVFTAQPAGGVSPAQFTVALRDPTGATTSGDTAAAGPMDARRIELHVLAPAPGAWTYEVTTDTAVVATYTLDVVITGSVMIEETVTIAAGEAFEINVRAQEGALMAWDWQTTGHVEWNIHTHEGGFEAVVEDHTDASVGEYTTSLTGIHSYFWQADADVSLTFRVWGDYEVLSIVD